MKVLSRDEILKKAFMENPEIFIDEEGHCEVPNAVTEIPECAFCGCKNLISINLPEDLKVIREYAFSESGLRSIRFPKKIETIEAGAFSYTDVQVKCDFDERSNLVLWKHRGVTGAENQLITMFGTRKLEDVLAFGVEVEFECKNLKTGPKSKSAILDDSKVMV